MKKTILALALAAVSALAIGFCATASIPTTCSTNVITGEEIHTHSHVDAQGSRCSGTVGCSCTGFSPITNGKEWQKAYCRKCGHSRSCHR